VGSFWPAPGTSERFVTWRRVVEWALIVAGFIVVPFVKRPATLPEWALLISAGVLIGVPVVLSSYRENLREQEAKSAADLAVEYEARLGLTLGDAITPLADLLGRICLATGDERARLLGQLRQRAVDAAAELCGSSRARAIYFALRGGTLVPEAWAGRAEHPSVVFVKTDPTGLAAHQLVEGHRRVLVADVRNSPLTVPLTDRSGAFLAVAVHVADREFGMLTVDTPEAGALGQDDLDIAGALAQVLGAGLAAGL
jgi:hypothetical protein